MYLMLLPLLLSAVWYGSTCIYGIQTYITSVYVTSNGKPTSDVLAYTTACSSVACGSTCGRTRCCAGYGYQKTSQECVLIYITGATALQPAPGWRGFVDKGYHTCSSSDYMVSGSTLNIPDSSLTASGLFVSSNCPTDDVSPPRARINTTVEGSGCLNKKSAACCLASQEPRWIQADLGEVRIITGVITRGRGGTNQYIKKYSIGYSNDGTTFHDYHEPPRSVKIFNGNNNAEIPVTNHFKCVFQARYVRIYPVPGQRKCLRFDILGCRLP